MRNQIQDIYSGERLTLLDFFEKKDYLIEIPIIQRDYAQGRASSGEIRDVFLDTLFTYLKENIPNRDLDFIYGSVTSDEQQQKSFIPLDGQQRLTTLFLLHWYLAGISENSVHFKNIISEDKKSKFTYKTRTTSREFCDALVSNDVDMQNLLPPDKDLTNSLSKTIQDQGWYYLSWENDPTIKSMLTMLDAIHIRFKNSQGFYERLTNKLNPVVTFLSLDLKEFRLTDDLYIKMNSRGKPLSPFENFKAKFEQHIDKVLVWNIPSPYKINYEGGIRAAERDEYFAHQIDTAWADLFWVYGDKTIEYTSFDKELMNFIRVIISANFAVENSPVKDDSLEYLFGTNVVNKKNDYTDSISYHRYQQFKALTKRGVTLLIDAFDKLANETNPIRIYLTDKFYYNEEAIFKKVLDHSLNQEQRVLFYAYIRFLIEHTDDSEGLHQWMRVIHNLTVNTIIDSADLIARAMTVISQLLPYSGDILGYLTGARLEDVDFFYVRQVQEEQLKAWLIQRSARWRAAIEAAERHSYFIGQVLFILDFAGVFPYFEANGHCNWSPTEDNLFYNSFKKYTDRAGAVFENGAPNKNFAWERAVLTKGDYLTRASQSRYNFLTSRSNRDYSWKRAMRFPVFTSPAHEILHHEAQRSYVRAVLDDPEFDSSDLLVSLEKICKSRPDDWRKYFILSPSLIHYCTQGFIRFYSSSDILLYMHSQQNHRHRELYTYNLYRKEIENQDLGLPFPNCYYNEVRTSDETPGIKFDDYLFKKYYNLEVTYDPGKDRFRIKFVKAKGEQSRDEYGDKVTVALLEAGFAWEEPNSAYYMYKNSNKAVMNTIKQLCVALPSKAKST